MRQAVFVGVRYGVAPDGRARPAPLRFGGSSGGIPGTSATATAESTTGPNGAEHPRIGSGGTVFGTVGRFAAFLRLLTTGADRERAGVGPPGSRAVLSAPG